MHKLAGPGSKSLLRNICSSCGLGCGLSSHPHPSLGMSVGVWASPYLVWGTWMLMLTFFFSHGLGCSMLLLLTPSQYCKGPGDSAGTGHDYCVVSTSYIYISNVRVCLSLGRKSEALTRYVVWGKTIALLPHYLHFKHSIKHLPGTENRRLVSLLESPGLGGRKHSSAMRSCC